MSREQGDMAREVFLAAAGPRLVKKVAQALASEGIPLMPLKGVLLQKLVYGPDTFRPISDVDLLVPDHLFPRAVARLEAAAFVPAFWERGRWQVSLRDPTTPVLGIDLHRHLTRTPRSRLDSAGLFARSSLDEALFGVPLRLPAPVDLFAHLLLHATLEWINAGRLHHPDDFGRVARRFSLDDEPCARHLDAVGMLVHAHLMLPEIAGAGEDGGWARSLAASVSSRMSPADRGRAEAIRLACARFPTGHPARRLAGLLLAPSPLALLRALEDRLVRPPAGGFHRV